jgi:hypothetical protein
MAHVRHCRLGPGIVCLRQDPRNPSRTAICFPMTTSTPTRPVLVQRLKQAGLIAHRSTRQPRAHCPVTMLTHRLTVETLDFS